MELGQQIHFQVLFQMKLPPGPAQIRQWSLALLSPPCSLPYGQAFSLFLDTRKPLHMHTMEGEDRKLKQQPVWGKFLPDRCDFGCRFLNISTLSFNIFLLDRNLLTSPCRPGAGDLDMLGWGMLEHSGSLSALPGLEESLGLAMPVGVGLGPSGLGSLWMDDREVRCMHTNGLCN